MASVVAVKGTLTDRVLLEFGRLDSVRLKHGLLVVHVGNKILLWTCVKINNHTVTVECVDLC